MMGLLDEKVQTLKNDWYERPEPERRILTIVGLLMLCCVVYFFLVEPVSAHRDKQHALLAAKTKVYTQAVPLVNRIKSRSSVTDESSKGLAKMVDSTLQQHGLTMRGFQPGRKNDARLRLSDVNYSSLIQWLYEIEYQHNIIIEELSISPSKNNSLLLVNVRVKKG
jgi:general secretion pathway protein M